MWRLKGGSLTEALIVVQRWIQGDGKNGGVMPVVSVVMGC
jgi:hypothetical protein